MKSYLCRPKKEDGSTKLLCLSLLVLSAVSFYLPTLFPALKAWGQLLSVILLLLLVQICTKYLLTDYRYGFEEGQLLLSTRQGKREKNYGSLPLSPRCRLLDRAAFQQKKKELGITRRFSFCQNLYPKAPWYLVAPDGEGTVALIFEPDETLLSLLKELVSKEEAHE